MKCVAKYATSSATERGVYMSNKLKKKKIYSDEEARFILEQMELKARILPMLMVMRYDETLFKEIEDWIALAKKVLNSNITYKKRYTDLMAALYYALSLNVYFKGSVNPEIASEKYARNALEWNEELKDAAKVLMYNLLLQDKIYEACEILAKYDFDFEVKADGNGVMNRIYNYFPKNEDGYNALADKMQKSKENYQTYYRLFEQYQESYYYTKVLLQYTRRIGSNKDKILLYHYLRSWEEKNNAHPITKFETLCNRMTDLMEIASDIDFRNMIREVDKCLEKHKQEIYEMEMICPVFMLLLYQ